jgi:hypothetical protein
MHLLLLMGAKHITYFPTYLTYFLNKSKFVMNTSLPDIYNNLNNYSVTKRPLLQLLLKVKTKNILLFYFKNLIVNALPLY